ncbi:MAG: helix-turn-helix domain-containing protein [Muribaculaceae bacterium]|nr:helix-turn-helix domain-containing protein [Muribaculaceae bacterium]
MASDLLYNSELIYNIKLEESVSSILESDFWVLTDFSIAMLPSLKSPIKFSSHVSIFLTKGAIEADFDLMSHRIQAPAILNIRSGQIIQIKNISEDFKCSFIVMSKRFVNNLFILLKDCRTFISATHNRTLRLTSDLDSKFHKFYEHINTIFKEKENPYCYQAMVLTVSAFYMEIAAECFDQTGNSITGNSRIPDKFITLVQKYFKKERLLKFYADQLKITSKHLSRTMKAATGFSGVEWIERYVILEAKVLLKSTNLSIQQIADELNFPSQSFFGKYFKKIVGMSPKEFRNS